MDKKKSYLEMTEEELFHEAILKIKEENNITYEEAEKILLRMRKNMDFILKNVSK